MRYKLSILVLALIACGVPVAVVSQPPVETPSMLTGSPTIEFVPETTLSSVDVRFVAGCWNLRATPGGVVRGVVCDSEIRVLGATDSWLETEDGYLCPRAIGEAGKCELK